MSQTPPPPETDSVVSRTSILIFSMFLIGVTVGWGVGGELDPYVLCCGLAGMLAFMGIELARTQTRERQLLREQREFVARLERHLSNAPLDESGAPVWESEDDATLPEEVARLAD